VNKLLMPPGILVFSGLELHATQRVGLCAGRNSCSTARLGRNFLVHGQNTTAWSELQLLNLLILSPGWRKAHVGRGLLTFQF